MTLASPRSLPVSLSSAAAVALVLSTAGALRAGPPSVAVPPWSDASDIPVPRWAKSVAPRVAEAAVFRMPGRGEPRRGSLQPSARPPLFGAVRGPGCNGRWLLIGPFAWVCSDDAELAADDPPSSNPSSGPAGARAALPPRYTEDGLAVHYAFVGPDGASGFRDLAHAEDDTPEADLDPGFAVALVEETDAHGRLWGKTTHGVWIALEQLNAVHPLPLHGELVGEGDVGDMGWVLPEHVATYVDPKGTKAVGVRVRFDLVRRYAEERGGPGTGAAMIRVSPDGAPPEWLRDRDVAHPSVATPPDEVGGKEATERWVDVDLAHQTVIAYEGARPVYAALASTGRGPQGSETATPIGVHRIWAKLRASTMGNLGDEDAESRYSIEDVPYVQFFAKGVALHGAFWHHSFGHAHSHGCVNLAPVDARWLFEFTGPRMPVGWSAVLPAGTPDPGTVVRVR